MRLSRESRSFRVSHGVNELVIPGTITHLKDQLKGWHRLSVE